MEYHKTKDVVYVKELLGHKSLDMTALYIHLERALYNSPSDEFFCAVARKDEEIKRLIEAGFEYVCENKGAKFFRKRK
ncbi:hypothetical protein KEJ19_07305 [Candidatus Bathyarchaeota archaeon]|nr:hypothetical protein [Candidatus Bathyarchaeota archaeon]